MSWFHLHRRCESIERILRERIQDLVQYNVMLQEQLASDRSEAHARERELSDRILAVEKPAAAAAINAYARTGAPAAPMPAVRRNARPVVPAGSNPALTPVTAGHRPTAAAIAAVVAQRADSPPAPAPAPADNDGIGEVTYQPQPTFKPER